MTCVGLQDKGIVRMAGPDAETMLQDVISCEVVGLPKGYTRVGALLAPQGKILFEFLLSRDGEDGFLLELPQDLIAAFMQRMTMYRLRAKVDIENIDEPAVSACWDCAKLDGYLIDERFPKETAAFRVYGTKTEGGGSLEDYARLRVENGVAEAGRDYDLGDAFPHDVLMDLNGGVSLSKGCYVGQEVVSRMQHRGTARRRIVQVAADQPLPDPGTPIEAEGRNIGRLGTVSGNIGLALLRIDRVAKALDGRIPITAADVMLRPELPAWTGLMFPLSEGAAEDTRP